MTFATRKVLLMVAITTVMAAACSQQKPATSHAEIGAVDPLTIRKPEEADFKPVPGAPTCLKLAGLRGNPSKEAASFLTKMDPGCIAPRHWHSATEETVMLSGTGVTHMDGGAPVRLPTGAYSQFPAHHIHRFKCLEGATCYIMTVADAAFDIHWVDRKGAEIGLDQALSDAAKDATPWTN